MGAWRSRAALDDVRLTACGSFNVRRMADYTHRRRGPRTCPSGSGIAPPSPLLTGRPDPAGAAAFATRSRSTPRRNHAHLITALTFLALTLTACGGQEKDSGSSSSTTFTESAVAFATDMIPTTPSLAMVDTTWNQRLDPKWPSSARQLDATTRVETSGYLEGKTKAGCSRLAWDMTWAP